MQPHVHTGIVAFLFAGVSAVVFIKLGKIVAAKMADSPSLEPAGRWLGGLLD
jgi:hypothetical protein